MKRIVWLGTVLCLLLGCALPVSAGSVPEDLLHYDGAQIFFAEVLDCRTEGEQTQVVLRPVKTVKGEVPLGTEQTYDRVIPVGDFRFRENYVYLFAYFDENNPTNAFRVTDYDPAALSLVISEEIRDNMWGRMEKYLKNGSYTAAEAGRRTQLGLPESEPILEDTLPPLDRGTHRVSVAWVLLFIGGAALAAGGLCVGLRMRR